MLSAIRVLDFTNRLGWIAGRILADLGADVVKVEPPGTDTDEPAWAAHNLNKRRLVFDWLADTAEEALAGLARGTDIVLETAPPGSAEARRFDRARRCNARLIQVSITPFGRTGPRSQWLASDLELMAAGGAMSLAGEPHGVPVRITSPQSGGWAGAAAATAALTALQARTLSGRGQLVDVAAQAAVIAALANAPTFWDLERGIPTRAGAFITGRSVHGARYRVFWPCRDGYVNFILYGGAAGRRTHERLVSWMLQTGHDPGVLGDIDWSSFSPTSLSQAEVDAIEAPIGRFLRGLTKRAFLDGACEREMLGYPVSTVADIAADPQLTARAFWSDQPAGGGAARRFCGGFAVVNGRRLKIRHAPTEPAVGVEALIGESRARRSGKPRAAGGAGGAGGAARRGALGCEGGRVRRLCGGSVDRETSRQLRRRGRACGVEGPPRRVSPRVPAVQGRRAGHQPRRDIHVLQ